MRTLRWIAFIPIAFIASIIGGVFGHYFGIFGLAMLDDDYANIFAQVFSGLGSALTFVVVGIKIAAESTNRVKLVLAGIVIVLGGISALGSIFGGLEQASPLIGIAMVLAGIGIVRSPVKVFDEILKPE